MTFCNRILRTALTLASTTFMSGRTSVLVRTTARRRFTANRLIALPE